MSPTRTSNASTKAVRGDKLGDARGEYFEPRPEELRAKYHEWVPMFGFKPMPEAPGLYRDAFSEIQSHAATLGDEVNRARSIKRRLVHAASVRIIAPTEEIVVPRRIVTAVLFALKIESPRAEFRLETDRDGTEGREFAMSEIVAVCERALAAL